VQAHSLLWFPSLFFALPSQPPSHAIHFLVCNFSLLSRFQLLSLRASTVQSPLLNMLGLEILGAVASAIQLGVLCVSATNRLCAICSDHKLAKAIHAECLSLITEIDKRMLALTSDNRVPAQDLRQRLLTIQKRIERRRQRVWIIKWSGKLQLVERRIRKMLYSRYTVIKHASHSLELLQWGLFKIAWVQRGFQKKSRVC
jgi:hypothetical protein